ncbi:hypothetical protein ACHAPV_000567 [Trichoderma viride]
MAGNGKDDVEHARRYEAPYNARHPIPTISKYREEKEARQQNALKGDNGAFEGRSSQAGDDWSQDDEKADSQSESEVEAALEKPEAEESIKDTSQVDRAKLDPRKLKKDSKKERAEREVTDPVTHLPVKIHDFTDSALKELDENEDPFAQTKKTASGIDEKNKSDSELRKEQQSSQKKHHALMNQFPPPDLDFLRQEIASASNRGFLASLAGACSILAVVCVLRETIHMDIRQAAGWGATAQSILLWTALVGAGAGAFGALIFGVRDWTAKKVDNAIQDEIWRTQRRHMEHETKKYERETTLWLNSLLSSVWPLINPDLFTSLADTLEDVMQASLPKLIRMVSVDDIGQGSESLRILGIRWLPTGAAAQAVTEDGKIISDKDKKDSRSNTGLEETEENDNDSKSDNSVFRGMEAEEGDFINLEVAFAYRTRSTSKSFKERTKDMHLYLAFYLPGNLKIPVWVDLHGAVGTMRLRLQLTPDPPFFDLCTLTLLGQPKVNLSCVPLSKHGLNIMDIPFISNFVQSAVDAAMAQYVAPKSLTLSLKDMLAGDDFKKDTYAKGVLMVHIKRGYDFKMGDSGIPLIKDSSSDPYVSVGWAKFGKVLWSTRVLLSEMEPYWHETCFVLVTPEELNINERLRVQLWDSDRFTADDDLGRIEVDLKELMQRDESNGRMWGRTDGFRALRSGDNMPGKLEWSIGYFSKARIQECQFNQQTHDPEVRTMEQLKDKVSERCERKLREAMFKGASNREESELQQQKLQELKAEQDAMIISAPPPDEYPSGILSLQIHNITGLEVQKLSKNLKEKDGSASDEETGDGLPSAYCTVIINHNKTYKTRTKPQNTKPFFNASCERFIRNWRSCEVYVSVRDARLHEDHPLLGIVRLPLREVFEKRSQRNGFWPLSGGIGYGKIRLSMVWRSVQLQAPRSLIGWQYGTVNIQPVATSSDCPADLKHAKLKLRTDISGGKMYSRGSDVAMWAASKDRPLNLAVHKRYSSCFSIAFKDKKKLLGDKVTAFSVCWLKDIPDEEEMTLELPIWKGDIKRATANCLEQCGERIGTLKLKVTYWPGMGAAHSEWANNNDHMRDVVEVIDAARDNLRDDELEREAGIVDEEVSSDSDSSDEHEYIPDGSAEHKQGPLDQIRDYKRRDKALHRQHRGLMQWKAPRTAKWVKHKLDKAENSVTNLFDHRSKEAGIETEV